MRQSIYDFDHYKPYLAHVLERGERAKLAHALRCQTAFVSQVLNGKVDFSLEHSERITEFLKLSPRESLYFMLLVQKDRAGSVSLRKFFQNQIDGILEEQRLISSRIHSTGELDDVSRATYYSSWHFAAIHVALSIPALSTARALSDRLALPLNTVEEALAVLCQMGLAKAIDHQNYAIGSKRIHLDKKSPFIPTHHTNWRLKGIQHLRDSGAENLHYSSVITLSAKDAGKVQKILLEAIEKSEEVFRPSPEEEIFAFSVDYFKV